jgi:hypothetical protein
MYFETQDSKAEPVLRKEMDNTTLPELGMDGHRPSPLPLSPVQNLTNSEDPGPPLNV